MVAEERRRRERATERKGEGDAGSLQERLLTVYTYIMQMVPIISEVYNRSINLLTPGGKEIRGVARHGSRGWYRVHQHHRISHALTNDGIYTTVDKCILLAYHLYAWGFVLPFARKSRSLSFELTYIRLMYV